MNGNWRYALFVTMALLFATGHASAAPTDNPPTIQSGKLEILHSFCNQATGCKDGSFPASLVRGSDGALYGVTFTTIFRFDPATRKVSILQSGPTGSFTWIRAARDGGFYGGGEGGLFRLSLNGQLTWLPVAFCSDEWSITSPYFPAVEDSQGNLYGTTAVRDAGSPGPRGASHRSDDCLGGVLAYKVAPDGSFKSLHDLSPYAPGLVMAPDGNLYGGQGYDTIYRLTPDGAYTVLHTFSETVDGDGFDAPLVVGKDGMLYGNTRYFKTPDGKVWEGTLFRSTLDGQVTTLYVSHTPIPPLGYTSPEGNEIANMTLMPDGYFYGAYSPTGNNYGYLNGTIFRTAIAGDVTPLYHFDGVKIPIVVNDRLVRDSDNALYGVANNGGKYDFGMLFRYVPPPVQ